MHIPDGFLSTPVWASLGAVSLPAVGILAKKAQPQADSSGAPLLGVMGAFVFAAQMVNFPIAAGASSHLLGGALLAWTLGPAVGVIVMTAVLAIQAFVFQDGGVLALGANVFNLAIAGVLSAWAPYRLFGRGRYREVAIFTGAALSVLVSGFLAMSQILLSGIPIAQPLVGLSAGMFAVSALVEGVITVAVLRAIERINPSWVRGPSERGGRLLTVIGIGAVALAFAGLVVASSNPDALETLANKLGIASSSLLQSPMADYRVASFSSPMFAKATAALAGLVLVYLTCVLVGRAFARRGSA